MSLLSRKPIPLLPSMIQMALLLLAGLLLSPGARAGDAAEFRAHGFSSDAESRYFAFEEFGVQDGSGFPYSNIYIVDLEKDAWVDESPVRVTIKEENQPELAARVQAFQQATPLMQRYNIAKAGILMAASPLNEVSDKGELAFHLTMNPLLGDQPQPYRLQLSNIDVQDLNNCGFQNGRVMGYALRMTRPDGSQIQLHEEGSAPTSRGCPMRYHLVAVFAPERSAQSSYAVALIGVFSRGFEGPDLRYIALPFRL